MTPIHPKIAQAARPAPHHEEEEEEEKSEQPASSERADEQQQAAGDDSEEVVAAAPHAPLPGFLGSGSATSTRFCPLSKILGSV